MCQQALSDDDIKIADALLIRFCKKVEELYGKGVITPNMHMHCYLKDTILDYGPIQEFWLFSFERYNGVLGKQPNNNRAIEMQLMRRFLRNNGALSFSFPDEFREDFSSISLTDRLVESVLESVTSEEFKLPSRSSRRVLNPDELDAIHQVYCKLCTSSVASNVVPNSVCTKYSSVTLKGKLFGSAGRGKPSGNSVVLSTWDESLYGLTPTSLPDAGLPLAYIRPVNVLYYLRVTFCVGTSACPDSLLLAYLS